ncbi:MAG UNVERIFIED_CONTAM: hypothetical protein LVR18_39855 [Planctomycetaceae bacterium]
MPLWGRPPTPPCHHLVCAWEKQLLTLNDAQLLYLIDPEAAEKLQIARPNAPPQQ